MKTLVTPREVMSLAFSTDEVYNIAVVTDLDIRAAEERYLRPIVGRELYEQLLEGSYPSLRDDYIAPQVAAWTRYIVEPLLASRCDTCLEAATSTAENEATAERCRSLRLRARTLSRALTEHLNTRAADYPEYTPDTNPLNRCSIDGNIVQVY